MRHSNRLLFVIALIAICDPAAGMRPAPTELSSVQNKLLNTQWTLKSFGTVGAESPVVAGTSITLKFGADGRAGGSSGCNTFGSDYKASGDQLSFGRIISTKRACTDARANQQEQRFFRALESAVRFELADDRLTIFYDGERSALNFVNDSSSKPAEQYEDLNSPVTLLASFYNAVNAKEYERGYRYWETPPGKLEDFIRGYADTTSVQLIVEPPARVEGAAGSLYAEVPTVVVARHRDGGQRLFAGCYTMRKSNLSPTDVPKVEVWRIYKASMSTVAGDAAIPRLLADACRK
ncbi:MAG TPA: META domain-containing protein [Pyrinomonadaceae bacterium]|nr:META domain-containing protein [Pyrinomonadaceae bacterium]